MSLRGDGALHGERESGFTLRKLFVVTVMSVRSFQCYPVEHSAREMFFICVVQYASPQPHGALNT